jgi:hypothetical protein
MSVLYCMCAIMHNFGMPLERCNVEYVLYFIMQKKN